MALSWIAISYIYIYNPYRGADSFVSLLVSFRRAGKVAMRFREGLDGAPATLPVSFRYPSGILPACR